MRRTQPLVRAAGVLLAAVVLVGCGSSGDSGSPDSPDSPSASGSSGAAPADDDNLPDVCALLSNEEVTGFTGKQVDQVDPDDGSDASTRFCQWQGADLRLAVFVSRTTAEDFEEESAYPGASPVEGIGEAAYTNSGHLYVLDGDLQVDVYNSGADSVATAAQALAVAADLVEKLD